MQVHFRKFAFYDRTDSCVRMCCGKRLSHEIRGNGRLFNSDFRNMNLCLENGNIQITEANITAKYQKVQTDSLNMFLLSH